MRRALVLSALLAAGTSFAAGIPSKLDCGKELLVRVDNREVRLCKQSRGGVLVSPECASAPADSPCPAVAAAGRKAGDLPEGLKLEDSPMAGCLRRGGKATVARDRRYNQYCLCAFDGPTFVSCDAFHERD